MIRIQKITIHEFRGIRDLTFELKGENFSVCGPNGTGKSGIVDAIEFALTGNVSRLSGQGTGGLSVKEHGPHVDSRDKPDQAYVSLTFIIAATGKQATIVRTVKNARAPKITPNDTEVQAVLEHIELHPEFVLSRRELIKYVLSEPGQRSKEVQALLRLDKLETLRMTFQKICNATEKEAKPLDFAKKSARDDLLKALGIPQLTVAELLAEVNKRRIILALPEITKLEADTSLKDGLATAGSAAASRVSKPHALEDIQKLNEGLLALESPEFLTQSKSALTGLQNLHANAADLESLEKETLLNTALKIFDDKICPVCDTEWEPAEFRQHLSEKIAHLSGVKKKREAVETQINPIAIKLDNLIAAVNAVAKYGPQFVKPIDILPLKNYAAAIAVSATQLRAFLPLTKSIEIIEAGFAAPKNVNELIAEITKAVNEIPEPSQQDSARDYLVVGQEKLEAFRKASAQLEAANAKHAIAKKVHEKYGEVVTDELESIYKNVEESFRTLYRVINSDDESAFEAKLTPSMGRLGFDVDFYGRGFFPPGAYHSEGHQDGMGLCLYLALMEHLLGPNFTFAVLDDVLMSVDSGHRREVCTLLKQKFPSTQFILTTHDDIWLKHMKTAGLIKNKGFVHFRTWSVELGPTEWSDRDIWEEIAAHLAKNDVKAASGLLRHYLEYFSKEACHRLRAPVVFRGDAQFSLGELMPPAVKRMRDLLKDGKKSADSWGHADKSTAIAASQTALDTAAKKSEVEQWQINTAIHYNEWANLNKNDFAPVVEAFKEVLALFECDKCNEVLYVIPERGTKEALRCGCGLVNINLLTKS